MMGHLCTLLRSRASFFCHACSFYCLKEPQVSLPARIRTSLVVFAVSIAGCAAVGDGGARTAAVQKALDASPPVLGVPRGKACELDSPAVDAWMDPTRFKSIKEVKIAPAGHGEGILADASCYAFSWDSSVVFDPKAQVFNGTAVPLGRLIVDKVGDDETVAGVQAAPFRAHFEPTDVGKELIAAGLVGRPQDVANGHAMITKDADGNYVAQTQLQ